jgi:tetratricopeptide (TPR) repeat protein
MLLLLIAGLSPYLYLPLRAGTDNVFVFMARTNTWENFWWTVLRTGYGITPSPDLQLYKNQIKEFFILLFSNYSILWVLMAAGAYIIYKKSKKFFYFFSSAFLIIVFMVVIYNRSKGNLMWIIDIFLMPPQYIIMLFIIAGIYHIYGFFTQKPVKYVFLAAVFLLVLVMCHKNFEKNNNRYNYQAYDFGSNILKTMDKDSLYLCEGDHYIMPLYYIQIIEKQRQDIKLIPVDSLAFKWGMDNFNKKYGNVAFKENDPMGNLDNIVTYCNNNNIEIYKSTYSLVIDQTKGDNFRQMGLLQEYSKDGKPISPGIFELYSYNRELYDKYIEYSRPTSELVITYLYCMMQQGIELLYGKNLAGALQIYKKAECFPFKDEMKVNEPVFYYKFSYIYKDLKDRDDQIKYLKKAVELKENFWEAYQELGEAYSKGGNSAMATEMFENAKRYGSPGTQAPIQTYSGNNAAKEYLRTGDIKFKTGNYTGAIQDFTRAIQLDPKYVKAYLDRGVANKNLGNYKDAIKDYTRAIELNPGYAPAYNNRGNAKYSLNNLSSAIKDYNKAIELDPKYAEAYYNCGMVKDKLGDKKGAIEDLNKAEELGIKQAYDKIKEIQGR